MKKRKKIRKNKSFLWTIYCLIERTVVEIDGEAQTAHSFFNMIRSKTILTNFFSTSRTNVDNRVIFLWALFTLEAFFRFFWRGLFLQIWLVYFFCLLRLWVCLIGFLVCIIIFFTRLPYFVLFIDLFSCLSEFSRHCVCDKWNNIISLFLLIFFFILLWWRLLSSPYLLLTPDLSAQGPIHIITLIVLQVIHSRTNLFRSTVLLTDAHDDGGIMSPPSCRLFVTRTILNGNSLSSILINSWRRCLVINRTSSCSKTE